MAIRTPTPPILAAPLALALIAAAPAPALAQHDHDIIDIGRGAAGEIVLHTHAPLPLPMVPSTIPGVDGYVSVEMAFESLAAPNSHGTVPLLPGADIRLILVSIDPGLHLYNGLTPLPVGGEYTLGTPFFHIIPLWSIDPGPLGGTYNVTIRARDAAGLHADSADFSFSFTPVPAPGAAVALGLGAVIAGRRRRR